MFKKIKYFLKLILPPFLTRILYLLINYRKIKHHYHPDTLFDDNDSLFKEEVKKVDLYGEYGCGKSTKWVLNNTSANVIAVDSSIEWVNYVLTSNSNNSSDRLNIHYVNLGFVGNGGRPINYEAIGNFSEYTDYIWNQKKTPKLVLIDGRFRVCCFLTSLKFAKEGTKILFDDYINRPYYHFVEKYVARSKEYGRQCMFVVPSKAEIDMAELDKDIISFRNVMD